MVARLAHNQEIKAFKSLLRYYERVTMFTKITTKQEQIAVNHDTNRGTGMTLPAVIG